MILSKRERYIVMATVAVAALLGLDRYLFSPLLAYRQQLQAQVEEARLDVQRADGLLENTPKMRERWNNMLAGGLKADVSEAESQALHALRDWAADCGLSLSSLKPERMEKKKQFLQVTFRATGTGSMRSISQFLYRIQHAKLPVRVTDMQVSARKEGTDDLQLTLGVSTICLAPPEPAKPGRPESGHAGATASIGWERN